MSCVVCGVVVVTLPCFRGQVMIQGLSSQGSVGEVCRKNPGLVDEDEAGVRQAVHLRAVGGRSALLCQARQSRGGLVGHEDAHASDRQ